MLIAIAAIAALACFGRRHARHRQADWEEERQRPSEFRQRATTSMRERFEEWHRSQHDEARSEPDPTPDDGNQARI